ncbi:MAG: PilZ domain-containing protein [Rhodospirillaceae bacterium]|jgi:hypothetical protein|nr:PilZ domain-containing protein [Rhodospirillaceae bacterium]MBT5459233.1 PilZ domain-containing protein [Rhodospirillaceae bacterium]
MNDLHTGETDRRRDIRTGDRILTLELEGQFYSTADWSLGGFMIDGYEDTLEPGNSAPVNIILEEDGHMVEQSVTAKIVRLVPGELNLRQLAAQFSDLSDTVIELLEGWQSGGLRHHI